MSGTPANEPAPMRYRVATSQHQLVVLARQKLGLVQHDFADAIGSSLRTVGRWEAGQSGPEDFHFHRLAKLLHPVDPDLAHDAATAGGTTLEKLGVVAPPPPAPAPAEIAAAARVAPPPPPALPARLLLDSVVCAAAEALEAPDAPPVPMKRARAAVEAAFLRARDLRLGSDEVLAAFASAVADELGPPVADDRGSGSTAPAPGAPARGPAGKSAGARRRTSSAP